MSRILSTGGACVAGGSWWGDVCGRGDVWWGMPGRECMAGGMHGRGMCMAVGHTLQGGRGICGRGRGLHGRGCAWQGGVCGGSVHSRVACMTGGCVAGEMATVEDGTHPTRIHSAFKI